MRNETMTPIQSTYALACKAARRHGDVIRLGERTLVREGRIFWLVSATGWVILALVETAVISLGDAHAVQMLEEELGEVGG